MKIARRFMISLAMGAFSLGIVSCDGSSGTGTGGGGNDTGGGGSGGNTAGGGAGGATGGTGGMMCDPAQCPAPSNECVDAVCQNGQCAEAPKPDETEAATQVAGDCKHAVCSGGMIVQVNDDQDISDDANDCTDDVCTDGVPSHPVKAIDTPCGPGGASFCDGSGACAECNTPDQCAGQDTECQARSCDAGVCGITFTPQGTATMAQTMGDCQVNQCDGAGAIETVADDADIEDDGNACTDDSCNVGAPVHDPTAIQTPCGPGLKCDGAGMCVGCIDVSDCPASGNPCIVPTCVAGMCGTQNAVDGVACDDGNACTQTDTCQTGACTGANPVICSAQDQCHDAGTCDMATGVCTNPNKADSTACNDGNACTQTDTCQAGTCTGANPVVCTALDQCHDAGVCNMATGVCTNPNKANGAACSDGNSCTQTDTCQNGSCMGANPVVCTALDQCHNAGVCAPATGMCSNPNKANGVACNDGNACTQTDTCQAGTCSGANPVVCTALDQCHNAGTCAPATGMCSNPNKPDGTACTLGGQNGTCGIGACMVCGNGSVEGTEGCDDGNATPCDGCSPKCQTDASITYATAAALNLAITDDGYTGALASMTCASVTVTASGDSLVDYVCPNVSMNHTWVGDLVIKLVSPANTVVTLMSRPGVVEAVDDGSPTGGDSSNLVAGFPVTWKDGAAVSAENMGNTIANTGNVCQNDGICLFDPNAGAALPGKLNAFIGQAGPGTWKLCVGDGGLGDIGNIQQVKLIVGQ